MNSNTSPAVLENLEMESRRVLLRVNFDVPIDNGKILDDSRIRVALPSIEYLVRNDARVILMSHLGDPKGVQVPELTLEPVAAYLASFPMFNEIYLTDSCVGDGARSVIQGLKEGQICLLENLAFHAGEEKNDEKLAKQLASFCDIYVNEAFSVSERKLASTCAICKHARLKAAGLQFAKETEMIGRLVKKPARPFVAVLGGDNLEQTVDILEKYFESLDSVLLGGSVANTFIAAKGVNIGESRARKEKLPLARDILERAARKGLKIIVPEDVKVVCEGGNNSPETISTGSIESDMKVVDTGPSTLTEYSQIIRKSETVIWIGKMGEITGREHTEGTIATARAIAGSAASSVAAGVEAVEITRKAGLEKGFTHLCQGEEAATELLLGKPLAGLTALFGN